MTNDSCWQELQGVGFLLEGLARRGPKMWCQNLGEMKCCQTFASGDDKDGVCMCMCVCICVCVLYVFQSLPANTVLHPPLFSQQRWCW